MILHNKLYWSLWKMRGCEGSISKMVGCLRKKQINNTKVEIPFCEAPHSLCSQPVPHLLPHGLTCAAEAGRWRGQRWWRGSKTSGMTKALLSEEKPSGRVCSNKEGDSESSLSAPHHPGMRCYLIKLKVWNPGLTQKYLSIVTELWNSVPPEVTNTNGVAKLTRRD